MGATSGIGYEVTMVLVMIILLSCLCHSFRCHIMSLYEQWTLVVLYDFDTYRVVLHLCLNTLGNEVWVGRLRCWCLVNGRSSESRSHACMDYAES